MYELGATVRWIHIADPRVWTILPFEAMSPLALQLHRPGAFCSKVLIRQVGTPASLLKHAFGNKVTLSYAELQRLASFLELVIADNASRKDVLEALARKICEGDPPDVVDEYVRRLLDMDTSSSRKNIDPITELAYDELDPDDKKEFGNYGNELAKQNKKRKISEWQRENKKDTAAKAKAAPRKRQRVGKFAQWKRPRRGDGDRPAGAPGGGQAVSGSGGDVAPAGGQGSSGPRVPPPPPAPELPPPALWSRAPSIRNPDVFDWGIPGEGHGRAHFRFTAVTRSHGCGYAVTCSYHAKQLPLASLTGELRPCSRELSLSEEDPDLFSSRHDLGCSLAHHSVIPCFGNLFCLSDSLIVGSYANTLSNMSGFLFI